MASPDRWGPSPGRPRRPARPGRSRPPAGSLTGSRSFAAVAALMLMSPDMALSGDWSYRYDQSWREGGSSRVASHPGFARDVGRGGDRPRDRPACPGRAPSRARARHRLVIRSGRPVRPPRPGAPGGAVHVPYTWDVAAGGSVRLAPQSLLDLVGRALDGVATAAGPLSDDIVAGGISCIYHSIVGLDGAPSVDPRALMGGHHERGRGRRPARSMRPRGDPRRHRGADPCELLAGAHPAAATGRSPPSAPGQGSRTRGGVTHGTGGHEPLDGVGDRVSPTAPPACGAEPLAEPLSLELHDLPPLVDDDEVIVRPTATASRRWPWLAGVYWARRLGRRRVWERRARDRRARDGRPHGRHLRRAPCHRPRRGAASPRRAVRLSARPRRHPWRPAQRGRRDAGVGRSTAPALTGGLERQLAALEPISHDLTVLPYTFGERGPGYHDRARGALVGLHADTDAAAVYRAILESIIGNDARTRRASSSDSSPRDVSSSTPSSRHPAPSRARRPIPVSLRPPDRGPRPLPHPRQLGRRMIAQIQGSQGPRYQGREANPNSFLVGSQSSTASAGDIHRGEVHRQWKPDRAANMENPDHDNK